jgi:hypothetical protein
MELRRKQAARVTGFKGMQQEQVHERHARRWQFQVAGLGLILVSIFLVTIYYPDLPEPPSVVGEEGVGEDYFGGAADIGIGSDRFLVDAAGGNQSQVGGRSVETAVSHGTFPTSASSFEAKTAARKGNPTIGNLEVILPPEKGGKVHGQAIAKPFNFEYDGGERGFGAYALPKQCKARGVLLLAHGCGGSATDFFDECGGSESQQEKCIGQPVERHLVLTSLAQGLAVVAISSSDRDNSRCWSFDDVGMVKDGLANLRKLEPDISELPLLAIGASSGGSFVSMLAASFKSDDPLRVRSVAVQIMGVSPRDLEASGAATVMWHMPRDGGIGSIVERNVAKLKEMNKQPWMEVLCEPLSVGPDFFSRWSHKIDEATSKDIVGALTEAGFLDGEGKLTKDPRKNPEWRKALESRVEAVKSGAVSLVADASPVPELLNTAYGVHSWCTEGADRVLAFLVKHGGVDPVTSCKGSEGAQSRR